MQGGPTINRVGRGRGGAYKRYRNPVVFASTFSMAFASLPKKETLKVFATFGDRNGYGM